MSSRSFGHHLRRGLQRSARGVPIDPFPLRRTLRHYSRGRFGGDLRGAINVALLAFPQAMAYALIAGLPVSYGIFGATVAAFVAPLFARGPYISVGPTNATAVLLLSSFAGTSIASDERLAYLPLLLGLAGIFLLLGALVRAAAFIQFVSRTVITGYITAAACLIILNQVHNVLGFPFSEGRVPDSFLSSLIFTVQDLTRTEGRAVLVSGLTLGLYLLLRHLAPRLPTVAITLVLASALAAGLSALGLEGLRYLDPVRLQDWQVTLPPLDFAATGELVGPALALALLCIMEGSSIGKSLAARTGHRLDSNQEMFSLGAANLACGALGGMPASGSLLRSKLNMDSGARTPMASVLAGGLLLLGALLLGPLVRFVPQATLGVLILVIGFSLFNRHVIRLVTHATGADAAVFLLTVAVGLLLGLDTAIYAGVGLSVLLFLRQAARPELVEYQFTEEGQLAEMPAEGERAMPEVSIVHVEGNLFFGAADLFRDQMRRVFEDNNLKVVVLRMRNARHLDASSVLALDELITFMREQDRHLVISGIRKDTFRVFRDSGLLERIGRENIFPESTRNPTLATANAMRRAQEILGVEEANITIYTSNNRAEGHTGGGGPP